MSNPRAKAERSSAKDIRQGGTDIRERTRSSKKYSKQYKLQWRGFDPRLGMRDWMYFNKYKTLAIAISAYEVVDRKYEKFEFRVVKGKEVVYPEEMIDEA